MNLGVCDTCDEPLGMRPGTQYRFCLNTDCARFEQPQGDLNATERAELADAQAGLAAALSGTTLTDGQNFAELGRALRPRP